MVTKKGCFVVGCGNGVFLLNEIVSCCSTMVCWSDDDDWTTALHGEVPSLHVSAVRCVHVPTVESKPNPGSQLVHFPVTASNVLQVAQRKAADDEPNRR